MASVAKTTRLDEEEGGDADNILNMLFGDSDEDSEDKCAPTDSNSFFEKEVQNGRKTMGGSGGSPDNCGPASQICESGNGHQCLEDQRHHQMCNGGYPRNNKESWRLQENALSCKAWAWQTVTGVSGLSFLPDFLSPSEQEWLVESIKREGWFRTPSQNQAMRFGNLPSWLEALGSHVHKAILYGQRAPAPLSPHDKGNLGDPEGARSGSHVNVEIPDAILSRSPFFDQTIANSYEPTEGILPHVDLLRFEDGIAIVSLLSDCIMTFTRNDAADTKQPSSPSNAASPLRETESNLTSPDCRFTANDRTSIPLEQGEHDAVAALDHGGASHPRIVVRVQEGLMVHQVEGALDRQGKRKGEESSELDLAASTEIESVSRRAHMKGEEESAWAAVAEAGRLVEARKKQRYDHDDEDDDDALHVVEIGGGECGRCMPSPRENGEGVCEVDGLSVAVEKSVSGCGEALRGKEGEGEGEGLLFGRCDAMLPRPPDVSDGKEEGIPLLLSAGSLLFMCGDARYRWKHGICREGGKQEWRGREVQQLKRWSITLRRLCQHVE